MSKKFVSKKSNGKKILKFLKITFLLVVIYGVYKITFKTLLTIKVMSSNENFLSYLITDTNHNIIDQYNSQNMLDKIVNYISQMNLKKPVSIISGKYVFENIDSDELYNEQYGELKEVTKYISDPNPSNIDDPIVYLYNSHQLENYSKEKLENYNVSPNVMMTSYLLKEKLNNLGIPTIVEKANIVEFMNVNGWNHNDSYKASRFYILESLSSYPNLRLLIDIHRDALNHEEATTIINDKQYAKVLFVVGGDNNDYQNNLKLAESINEIIKNKYPSLTRGVIVKKGAGVDGVYNQDLDSRILLIEIGGNESNIEEVMNTTVIISNVIKEYLGDNNE